MTGEKLTVKETAEILKVSEKTVYRWIQQGVIPTFKLQGQYRFDRGELEGWARYKRIGVGVPAGDASGGAGDEIVELPDAVRRGGIHYKIEGSGPEEIFRNVVQVFPFGPGFPDSERETLVRELMERETLVPTGIGNGIALPHPRHPRDWGLGAPVVGLFYLEKPVDFKAMDGQPVFLLVVILCATIKGHLNALSLVAHLLNDPATREYLATKPTRTELMEQIEHALPQSR